MVDHVRWCMGFHPLIRCADMLVQYLSGKIILNTVIDGSCRLVTRLAREHWKYLNGYGGVEFRYRDLQPQLVFGSCIKWHDEEGAKV